MAVVLDTPAVSRGSGNKAKSRERDIRKAFVDRGLIETVILLPENLFYNTGAPGLIVVVNTTRSPGAPVRLVNASQLFEKGQPKNFLTEAHIDRIVEAASSDVDIDDLCRVVPATAIEDLDYDLSPSRHVPLDPQIPAVPLHIAVEAEEAAAATAAAQRLRRVAAFNQLRESGVVAPADRGWLSVAIGSVLTKKIAGEWGEDVPLSGASYSRCLVIRGTDFPDVAQLRLADVPIRFVPKQVATKKRPTSGDVLVETSGGGKYQNTGRALYISEELVKVTEGALLHTNFTKLLRVDQEKMVPKYFFYYWSMLYELGRTARYEKQPTNIKNFKLDDFLAHEEISFPVDKKEQEAIIEALDAVHDDLKSLDAARNMLLSVRHAAFKALFSAQWSPTIATKNVSPASI